MNKHEIFVGVLGLQNNFRGSNLVQKVEAIGLSPQVIWGIPVDEIGVERILNYANQKQARYITGRELTPQEISCALGHLEMYEWFLNSGKKFALFLEDDADFDANLEKLLQIEFPSEQPIILHIGGYLDPRLLPKPFPATFPKIGEAFRNEEGILRCLHYPVYAHGYLLNRSAAQLAVHLMRGRKINSPADFPFAWRTSIPFYITTKQIVWQRDSISNIEGIRSLLEGRRGGSSKANRRLKRIFVLNPFYLLYGERIGLSGRAILREKVFYYFLSKFFRN